VTPPPCFRATAPTPNRNHPMSFRYYAAVLAAALLAAGACGRASEKVKPLPTAAAERGDLAVRVQASGVVEPVDPVDVKSKTAGLITKMPVDVGSIVRKGDLIVQVDPRDVRNQLEQAMADSAVSMAGLNQARLQRNRADSLFKTRVITRTAVDSARVNYATASADYVSARANLDLARQRVEDATVRAPIAGTVVSKPAATGQIIMAATGFGGGTTVVSLADLGRVRMRVTIDESEMANVRIGETANVVVDAFPDRPFTGQVEKIEPQAVVNQGVTFFPVLVNISNKEGLLMPGMNGEVTIVAADRKNVVRIPIDAVRKTTELAPTARLFGYTADSLVTLMRPELVSTTVGANPTNYVVVALSDSTYELREVKTGANDLTYVEVVDGLREGDRVALLGSLSTGRPKVWPTLKIASNMLRSPSVQPAGAARK